MRRAALVLLALGLAGCGGAADGGAAGGRAAGEASAQPAAIPHARPQVIEPAAGQQALAAVPADPVGDVHAHAMPLSQVRRLLREQAVVVPVTDAQYVDPLRYVTVWGRTDQGVDASMPVGAPILAPGTVKILAVIPDWYAGQPLVYFELLDGRYAGRVQYVAEQITGIARPGTILQRGQTIARYAKSGTAIEYGWSTLNGITLARATTGYEEGEVTPAGANMRGWLNDLGANAGSG
ncbi:MAG: hypothetical protein ACRDNJ_05930 [Solirubrobacteraceae bacterium]